VRRTAADPPQGYYNQGDHRDDKRDEEKYSEHVRTAIAMPWEEPVSIHGVIVSPRG